MLWSEAVRANFFQKLNTATKAQRHENAMHFRFAALCLCGCSCFRSEAGKIKLPDGICKMQVPESAPLVNL